MSAIPPTSSLDSFLSSVSANRTIPAAPVFLFRYHPDGYILPPPGVAARLAYRNSLDEESCMSFSEWKSAGYFVKKGSKSFFQDALGIPQFTKEQVEKSQWQRRY
jgi:hypothetical protein